MNTIYETSETTIRISQDDTLCTVNWVSGGLFFVVYNAGGTIHGPSTSLLMIV